MDYQKRLESNLLLNIDEMMSYVVTLYENPEIGNEEFKAMEILSTSLKKHGFNVETGFVVPTGFIGKYDSGKAGPTLAYLCEFDALPEVGHGCGHNLIAGISLAAGIALKSIIDELGGQVWVIGTPAEESFGGKVSMAEAHVFDAVDVVMMIHPSNKNGVGGRTNALNPLKFEFFGKNAHGCSPQQGRSALDAAVLSYININLLRQYSEPNTFIHGIIRNGGSAANVIPAYASLEYYFRGSTMKYVQALSERAIDCVKGACLASDTTYKMSVFECPYEDFNLNYKLCALLQEKYEIVGIQDIESVDEVPKGSSDIGAVSYQCPALHGYIKIAEPSVLGHSKEMACATISKEGKQALYQGALSLALVGVDLIIDKDLYNEVVSEFKTSIQSV